MLTREQILAASIEREILDVPEWGGEINVRGMTGTERERFELAAQKRSDCILRALVAAMCVCDGDGKALFTQTDVPALAANSAAALDRVFDVAVRLSGITTKELDSTEKKSVTTPGDSSSSTSPAT
jgi:hypothetical protein